MMKRALLLVLLSGLLGGAARAKPPAQKPNITMAAARVTALKRVPGKIKSAELEEEGGKLLYSFDITDSARRIMEVHVDAMTGEVLEVQEETPAKERAEKAKERAEKAKERK